MNKILSVTRPNVLVADFDRTLTSLYRDTNLLIELANLMVEFYSKYVEVPLKYKEGKIDGYYVWHELHNFVEQQLTGQISEQINKTAEDIVANFELEIIKRIGLFDGITDTIRKLSNLGIRLGIVSSNATSIIKFALEEARILDKFEYVGGRPYPFNPALIKPNAYPINKALSVMNASTETFWYVGDDIVDMIAANSACVTAVGVCTGRHSKEELINAGAAVIFNSFNDITEYFDKSE